MQKYYAKNKIGNQPGENIMKEFFVERSQFITPFLKVKEQNFCVIRTQCSLSSRTFAIENRAQCSVRENAEMYGNRL